MTLTAGAGRSGDDPAWPAAGVIHPARSASIVAARANRLMWSSSVSAGVTAVGVAGVAASAASAGHPVNLGLVVTGSARTGEAGLAKAIPASTKSTPVLALR